MLVGFVGRLAAEKQVEDLAVLGDLPGIRLVVIGDGPERERLAARLPGAHFTGELTGAHLSRAVASLDVVVHPGPYETFCQAAQEAMASGVPVAAVGSGGLLDLVDSSRTGWLYPPTDLRAMRARVADLAGDPADPDVGDRPPRRVGARAGELARRSHAASIPSSNSSSNCASQSSRVANGGGGGSSTSCSAPLVVTAGPSRCSAC